MKMASSRCLDAVFMIIRASTHLARGPRPCRDCICATQVIDEPKLRAARSGRLGFTFVVIAMRCWQAACQMFLPNRTTQRELDIQKRRDPAAEKEDIWNPNARGRGAVSRHRRASSSREEVGGAFFFDFE